MAPPKCQTACPNPVYDFGEEDGLPYLVMELVDGVPLDRWCDERRLEVGGRVALFRKVCEAVDFAHRRGVVHRDLKPSNVLVTLHDGAPMPKVIDFGIAKATNQRLTEKTLFTRYAQMIGTPAYMSPEQCQGVQLTPASDQYALGIVLYEMATGRRAFARDTAAETMTAILREQPGDFDVTAGDVSPELRRIVTRCLEKNPKERFQSAQDLAFDLRSIATQTGASGKHWTIGGGRDWRWLALGSFTVVLVAVVVWNFALNQEALKQAEKIPRIVVLPFENLGSPDDEYFADGISEEITSRLSAVSGVQVISRSSAMYYKDRHVPVRQIGEELDVGYVLEGTIRWDRGEEGHGRVRITPQLIRVADDSHLWSERYDRVLEDIFTVQSDIAKEVIDRLQTTLLDIERSTVEARPTDNMEAYQAYLLGYQYNFYRITYIGARFELVDRYFTLGFIANVYKNVFVSYFDDLTFD